MSCGEYSKRAARGAEIGLLMQERPPHADEPYESRRIRVRPSQPPATKRTIVKLEAQAERRERAATARSQSAR